MHSWINYYQTENYPPPSSDDPCYKAREKLNEAQQNAKNREKLIKEALRFHPNSPDAFLLLANDAKSSREYHPSSMRQ
jgi:hypothetical protein